MTTNDLPVNEHLKELRTRLLYSIISVFILAIISLQFSDFWFDIIKQPFNVSFKNFSLIGTSPGEAFILKLKLAFFSGILLSAPLISYHIWKFISPGLHDKEKKLVVPFLAITTLFFVGGAYFAYKIILPIALSFFADEYKSLEIEPNIKIGEYFSLVIQGILIFGVMFELPIIFYILGRFKLITSEHLIKYWRHSITGIFIISAIFTPPDVVSQCLMAFPMIVLYLLSIVVVKISYK